MAGVLKQWQLITVFNFCVNIAKICHCFWKTGRRGTILHITKYLNLILMWYKNIKWKPFTMIFSWQFYYSCLQIYFEINKYNATVYIVLKYIKEQKISFHFYTIVVQVGSIIWHINSKSKLIYFHSQLSHFKFTHPRPLDVTCFRIIIFWLKIWKHLSFL